MDKKAFRPMRGRSPTLDIIAGARQMVKGIGSSNSLEATVPTPSSMPTASSVSTSSATRTERAAVQAQSSNKNRVDMSPSTFSKRKTASEVYGTPRGSSGGSYFQQHERRKKFAAVHQSNAQSQIISRRGRPSHRKKKEDHSKAVRNSNRSKKGSGDACESASRDVSSSSAGYKSHGGDSRQAAGRLGSRSDRRGNIIGKTHQNQSKASGTDIDASIGPMASNIDEPQHLRQLLPRPMHDRNMVTANASDRTAPLITYGGRRLSNRATLPDEHPNHSRRTPSPKLVTENSPTSVPSSSSSSSSSTTASADAASFASTPPVATLGIVNRHFKRDIDTAPKQIKVHYPTTRSLMQHMQHRRPAGHRRSSSGSRSGSSGSPLVKTRHRVSSSTMNPSQLAPGHGISLRNNTLTMSESLAVGRERSNSSSSADPPSSNAGDSNLKQAHERIGVTNSQNVQAPREIEQEQEDDDTQTEEDEIIRDVRDRNATVKLRSNRWNRKGKNRPAPLDTSSNDSGAGKSNSHSNHKNPGRSPGMFGGSGPTGTRIGGLSQHPSSPAKSAAHLMEFVNAQEGSSFAAAAAKATENITEGDVAHDTPYQVTAATNVVSGRPLSFSSSSSSSTSSAPPDSSQAVPTSFPKYLEANEGKNKTDASRQTQLKSQSKRGTNKSVKATRFARRARKTNRGSAPDLLQVRQKGSSNDAGAWARVENGNLALSAEKSKTGGHGAVLFEFPLWSRKKKEKKVGENVPADTSMEEQNIDDGVAEKIALNTFVPSPTDRPRTTPEKVRRQESGAIRTDSVLDARSDAKVHKNRNVHEATSNHRNDDRLGLVDSLSVQTNNAQDQNHHQKGSSDKEDEAMSPTTVATVVDTTKSSPSPPIKTKARSSSRGGIFGLFRRREKVPPVVKKSSKDDKMTLSIAKAEKPGSSVRLTGEPPERASTFSNKKKDQDTAPIATSDSGAVIYNFPLWDRKKILNRSSNALEVQTMLLPQSCASSDSSVGDLTENSLDLSETSPKIPTRLPESEMKALLMQHTSPMSRSGSTEADTPAGSQPLSDSVELSGQHNMAVSSRLHTPMNPNLNENQLKPQRKQLQAPLNVAVSPKVLGSSNLSPSQSSRSSSTEGSPVGSQDSPQSWNEHVPKSAAEAVDKRSSSGPRQPTPPKNKRAHRSQRGRGPRTKTIDRRNSPQDLNKQLSKHGPSSEISLMPATQAPYSHVILARSSSEKASSPSSVVTKSAESVVTDMEMSFSFSKAEAAAAALGENVRLDDSDEDAGEDGMEITQAYLENSNYKKHPPQRCVFEANKSNVENTNDLPPRERSPTPKHQTLVRGASGGRAKSTEPSPLAWKKGEQIGRGTYGHVHMALNQTTGELFCVKSIRVAMGGLEDISSRISALEKEISVMKRLEHPHIVRYLGTERAREDHGREDGAGVLSNLPNQVYIFLEYIPGGSLSRMLKQFGGFSTEIIRRYTKQILHGLVYLHNAGIIHRDVKGANVLVTETGVAKLADFGCSKQLQGAATGSMDESLRSIRGSVPWMAPEVIKQSGAGRSADIWSLGCTVIEMATAKRPWPDLADNFSALFHVATAKCGPPYPEVADPDLVDFLDRCFCLAPEERASADELLRHPLVAEVEDVIQLEASGTTVSKSANF